MNIGQYVFEQTTKHAKTNVVKCPIAFPTLLCGIMLEQYPSLITVADILKKMDSPLTLHPKLFSVDHVPDIVGTSGSASDTGRMTKQEIVAALKDTCALLDERKAQFELMIHSLEGENVDDEDEQAESEKEEEVDNAEDENEDGDEDSDNSSEAA